MNDQVIFITGIAGFIGYHLAQKLASDSESTTIIGIDNLNDYYDVSIKHLRLQELKKHKNITFIEGDIADNDFLSMIAKKHSDITFVFHLAAQAGVSSSLTQPFKYVHSNLVGQVSMMEFVKQLSKIERVVYASSSSVYGAADEVPFVESNPLSLPFSLYAATKQADEVICATYSRLLDLPMVGLRFFTAYGHYGRPDMAIFKIAKTLLDGSTVKLVSDGQVTRDFTHISDIIEGIICSALFPMERDKHGFVHDVFNLGTGEITNIIELTKLLAKKMNINEKIEYVPKEITDMQSTLANVQKSKDILGYSPKMSLSDGLDDFLLWFVDFYKVKYRKK